MNVSESPDTKRQLQNHLSSTSYLSAEGTPLKLIQFNRFGWAFPEVLKVASNESCCAKSDYSWNTCCCCLHKQYRLNAYCIV